MATKTKAMAPPVKNTEATVLITDNELLGRYLFKEDASAFEELVRRHSGLVMGVCRNMLFHSHDAEDAFQATFLILSRKCHSLLEHGSIAGWLYQTAMRNCLQIRRRKGRARETEMIEEPVGTNEPWQTISNAQETELIYQEINRLPKRYRDAIVLCHLQGHSRSEAAEFLDWTEAGVKAALARGRNLLRRRLIRSGLMTSVAIGMLGASTVNAQSVISEPLISSTLQHCSGLNPTISVGNGAHLVQTISNTGVLSMQTATIIKSLSLAASIALAVCVPLVLIAQQTELGSLAGDEIVSTIGSNQQEKVDRAISSVEIDSVSDTAKDETVAGALREFDSTFGQQPASQPTDPTSEARVPNVMRDDSELAGMKSDGDDEPGVYSKEDSKVYWELMLKSYTAQANSQHVGDKHDLTARKHEAEAKAVEARLNLKRIAARSNDIEKAAKQEEPVTAAQPEKRSISSTVPPSASHPVEPGEVLLVESLTDATLNRRVVVRSDHTISMPLVGTVSVKGQSTEEITQRVEARLVGFIKSPQIFVVRESASTPLKRER
jgi:RNA polymerase sigma factor (sigma-70 family)